MIGIATKVGVAQRTKTAQRLATTQRLSFFTQTPPPPPPIPGGGGWLPPFWLPHAKARKRGETGFKVLLRDPMSGLLGGKKVSSKKYRPIPGVFTKQQALGLGGMIVGGGQKASFKVEPTTDAIDRMLRVDPFKTKQYYKTKSGMYIEKTRFRINEPGELAAITEKGLEALKRKPRKKKKGGLKFGF